MADLSTASYSAYRLLKVSFSAIISLVPFSISSVFSMRYLQSIRYLQLSELSGSRHRDVSANMISIVFGCLLNLTVCWFFACLLNLEHKEFVYAYSAFLFIHHTHGYWIKSLMCKNCLKMRADIRLSQRFECFILPTAWLFLRSWVSHFQCLVMLRNVLWCIHTKSVYVFSIFSVTRLIY